MFIPSAEHYDSIYDFIDYKADVGRLQEVIGERAPAARTLLDVACGSGRHLEFFREKFEVEGLDVSSPLLTLAARRCPGVPLHEASMEAFDLPGRFDVITCLFSSIAYLETEDRMRRAVASMARHLRPGGLLLIEPWFEPERYWSDTITSNHSASSDPRICWMYTSKRDGDVSVLDIHYLVGTPDRVQHFSEEHRLGLFTKEQHMAAFSEAGLSAEFDPEGPFGRGRGLYIARAE